MLSEANFPNRNLDPDQYYMTGSQCRILPRYELNEHSRQIFISDPIWGDETIGSWPGDELFAELYTHPVFQRLAAIEQLTLPGRYATMPDSFSFSRWEHVWGSVVFARKMIRQAESEGRTFAPKEKLELQLRTGLSDAGQYAFSHLGDWLRQGFGGTEDSHDTDLMEYLEITGVNDILRRHDVDPEKVIFPAISDWIECSSPDLCVDRVDYGVREIARWVDPSSGHIWRNAFRIDESNQLVMKDEQVAKYFSACFGLLATEHWSHPVHRTQLQLFAELIKGAILNESMSDELYDAHPIDRLYTTDHDILANTRSVGELNNDLDTLLQDIARSQRRIFAQGKEQTIRQFLSPFRHGYENNKPESFLEPLDTTSWQMEYAGAKPKNIELIALVLDSTVAVEEQIRAKVRSYLELDHTLDIFLPALKPRAIDPLFANEDGIITRLSESDESYKAMLRQIREIQTRPYLARLYMAPDAAKVLKAKMATVTSAWEQEMDRPRTNESRETLARALQFIGISIIGQRMGADIRLAY